MVSYDIKRGMKIRVFFVRCQKDDKIKMSENQMDDQSSAIQNAADAIKATSNIVRNLSSIPEENTTNFNALLGLNLDEKMQYLSDVLETSSNEVDKMSEKTTDCLKQFKEIVDSIHDNFTKSK